MKDKQFLQSSSIDFAKSVMFYGQVGILSLLKSLLRNEYLRVNRMMVINMRFSRGVL